MTNKFTIKLCDARPGAGKTQYALGFMATRPAKYVYCVDRNNVSGDRAAEIQNRAEQAGKKPDIVILNCESSQNVRKELTEAPIKYNNKHTILIITHEALRISELGYFNGWHLIIDEAINSWTFHTEKTPIAKANFAKYFNLAQNEGSYHKVSLKKKFDTEAISADAYMSAPMMALYKACKNGSAFASVKSWDDANEWNWCAIWNFSDLEIFESIMIIASAFEQSLTYKLMMQHGIVFEKFHLSGGHEYKPRGLYIRYFDANNEATATYFQSAPGRKALGQIHKFFAESYTPKRGDIGFWSCNLDNPKISYADILKVSSQKPLPPMLAGSNSYLQHNECCMIYAAKPSTYEIRCLAELGITADEIVRSRETETLIQFVTRSSIRVADDARQVTFYVYSRAQAEQVANFFHNCGLPISVATDICDIGIASLKPSDEEKAELRRQKRKERNARFRGKK